MRAKIAAIVSALAVFGLAWWWITPDTRRGLREAEAEAETATAEGSEEHAGAADSKRDRPSRKPSALGQDRAQIAAEPDAARQRSPSSSNAVVPDGREPARGARDVYARDPGGGAPDDRGTHGSEDFERLKRLVETLRKSSQMAPGDDLSESDAPDLYSDDVDRLDVDEDHEVSPWEVERAQRRLERAEGYPLMNDKGDGAYPVNRGEYRRRPDEGFDSIDTDGDDELDVDEYYAFLVDVDRITFDLDVNGDRSISRDESGLSEGDFAPLDRDGSGELKPWEIRRAVALKALR